MMVAMLVQVLCWFLLLSVVSASTDLIVEPGQDVWLQCLGPRESDVTLLEWTRPDLKQDGYVLFYRNKRAYENYQLLSFRGRVKLNDPQMTEGDFSVVLKNVSVDDTGTYECRVVTNSNSNREMTQQLINLTVTASDSSPRLIGSGGNNSRCLSAVVGLSLALFLLLLFE